MPFGEELRQERERRGFTLDDISVSTRISVRYLEALEAERYTDLPGGVFNKGIVRSYARFCGLDETEAVQRFVRALRQAGAEREIRDNDWVQFAEAVQRGRAATATRQGVRWLGVVGMLLGVLLLLGGVFFLLLHRGVIQMPAHRKLLSQHALSGNLPARSAAQTSLDVSAG